MDVTVEGHTITAEEFQAGHWTPVLYKAYASRPASLTKPLHYPIDTSEANPDAKNAARVAAAATGGGKTPVRLPPVTKDARLAAQRSKQLPPLPPNAIRVVVRPRGEIRLREVPTPRLIKAVQAALRIALPEDFCLRIHPTNNTFTAATRHSPTAETLKTLTSLTIGGHTYQCVAYVAPPPGATRGVISNACDDETPAQLYQDLPTQHKQAWTVPLNQGWGPPPTSSEHASSLTTTSTLQGDLAKSREEVAAAKAEAQAARAEAAALREHIAKLEAQISTLATGLPALPNPTPNASQPPPPNPPTAPVLPNHLNPDIYANSLELDADAELPQQSSQCITPDASTPASVADIPTLLESFTARFEEKLQEALSSINQECNALKDALIRVTKDNEALNHRFDALTQGFTDRYNDLEFQLNSLSSRLPNRDLAPSRRKKPKATDGQGSSAIPVADHDPLPGATAPPLIDSHDGSS
ncbi:hypothetical protein HPB50_019040 [Hyalomma asiaticum]|uniref:Uncharacterized protein n=1 Tax=Hyalomma asiaticum TaxID=266040 RepID=A0ACB7SH39_HYAAI|nr:hypothetical protein HPB50_019040 [Hyalomma asiaticum]